MNCSFASHNMNMAHASAVSMQERTTLEIGTLCCSIPNVYRPDSEDAYGLISRKCRVRCRSPGASTVEKKPAFTPDQYASSI